MTRYNPSIIIRSLKLYSNGQVAYNQEFHQGLNIIRSATNSCGKSTIMDFIFYLLGGEVLEWTEAAQKIDFGLLEVDLNDHIITIKRERTGQSSPSYIFDGEIGLAEKNSTSWNKFGHRRSEKIRSFSQVIFEMLGLPELKSELDDNVTINQILRLIYCDQETSVNKVFKDVSGYDREAIRKSIVEILFGADDFELYTQRMLLSERQKVLSEIKGSINSLTETLQQIYKLDDFKDSLFELEIVSTENEIETIQQQINTILNVSVQESGDDSKEIKKLGQEIVAFRDQLNIINEDLASQIYDLNDSEKFIKSLSERISALEVSNKIIDLVGSIEFKFCPACLTPLEKSNSQNTCNLCKCETDITQRHFNRTKAKSEIDFQIAESKGLQDKRKTKVAELSVAKENIETKLKKLEREFSGLSSMPNLRDAELRQKISKIGYLERKIEDLLKSKHLAQLLNNKSTEKSNVSASISTIEDKIQYLTKSREVNYEKCMNYISKSVRDILMNDILVEEAFKNPRNVEIHFDKNKILVDGNSKFSASSEVILKNALYLSLFKLSLNSDVVNFPRFLLLDNIEDKGMTPERSHNLQKIIYEISKNGKTSHQIIFTTSMISSDLEIPELCVGPLYDRHNKTLSVEQ